MNPSAANAINGANGGTGSNLFGSVGQGFQTAGNVFGIASGIRSGSPTGYASAGINAGSLANKAGAFGGASSGVGKGLGAAGSALGIYSGIKQGGVAGYSGAAVNAATLGSQLGAFGGASGAVGSVAGYAAIPLSIYDFAKNGTASGKTGSDAINGATNGAAIGTAIMPGIGTAIGAIGGALAGALASAFGKGAVDPENANFVQYTQAFNKTPAAQQAQVAAGVQNPYLPLAGYFDLRSGQMKGSNPIYTTYGRMGEQKFTNDLISKVNAAKGQGITDPTQVYNNVVQPWISSMGTWNDSNKAAMQGLIQNMTGQVVAGTYQQNFKAIGGQNPFKNG